MIIRVPQKEEWEAVNNLAYQVHEMHVNWRPDIFLHTEVVISKELYEELIDNEMIYVAYENEIIIGYMTIAIKEKENPIMRYRKVLCIDAMCVDENCRGKGIGTNLLNFAKELGKEKGCTDLYLTVNEENENAIHLYEEVGFKVKNIAYSMEL